MTPLKYEVGETLPNGAVVVLYEVDRNASDRAFVLGLHVEGEEYVTWAVNDRGAYNGHYHSYRMFGTQSEALKEAVEDFLYRVGRKSPKRIMSS